MANLLPGVALISGASSGIGRATCVAFAAHGCKKIAMLDIDPKGAEETRGLVLKVAEDVEVMAIVTDMAKDDSIVNSVRQVVDRYGRIDYAVNNVGVSGPIIPSALVSTADFANTLNVNLLGMWIAQREEIKQMLKQEPVSHKLRVLSLRGDGSHDLSEYRSLRSNRGVIVNMSSTLGLVGASASTPGAAYSASKHGVIAITKTDANTYARENIRINAICPGFVATEAFRVGVGSIDLMSAEIAKVPMGRPADVEEIAEAICFLASPMSGYMSGSTMTVDGGFTAQ